MHAQGSLEYLIIIAAVLGISAVVVLFVTGAFTGATGGADIAKCRVAAANCEKDLALGVSTACSYCENACKDSAGREVIFGAINHCSAGKVTPIVAESGLVAGWHFDEGSGTTVNDASGNGYNSILSGDAKFVQGKYNTGIEFDNFRDYIEVNGLNLPTAAGTKVTVEFWMYWNGVNGKMPMGFSIYDLWLSSNCLGFNTGAGDIRGGHSTGLANSWVFVSAIFNNGDSTQSELYINGTKKTGCGPFGGIPVPRTVSSRMTIGCWNNPGDDNYWFGGVIDEFRVYNRALTPEEIMRHYGGG